MRKNKTVLLITLTLAVLAVILFFSRSNSTLNPKISDFAVRDTASITKIYMADKSDQAVLLTRKDQNGWTLNEQKDAHQENVRILLQTIANVEVREPVARAAHDNVLTLLASKSVKVEIYQNSHRIKIGNFKLFPYEKKAKTYYIGDATMDNHGTFALLEGADVPVVIYMPGLRGFVATRFSTFEGDWRVHTVFNKPLPEIKQIKVEFLNNPEESYTVINHNEERLSLVRMLDNQELSRYDTTALLSFVNAFRNIRYESLFNDMEEHKKDSIMNSAPIHHITLETKTGEIQSVRTFVRLLPYPEIDEMDGSTLTYDRDRMFALVNEEDFVSVQFFVFDHILLPLSFYTINSPQ